MSHRSHDEASSTPGDSPGVDPTPPSCACETGPCPCADDLVRLRADFENFRRRSTREMLEVADRATGELVTGLLDVLDSLGLAQAHGADPALEKIGRQLGDRLSTAGLRPVNALGMPFDPVVHDAIHHEASEDYDVPTVDKVVRPGYYWRDRLLRPATVEVRG